ncbi:unnamed protein product [Trichogramma brassicae]|uniref:Uncharacterized protein n=1 Tax=Trichogramma brassicae TaxID=86971 RepID=A0A6H5IB94_9HYME|nr:unnamed protein product [Trichogramma brassicae]
MLSLVHRRRPQGEICKEVHRCSGSSGTQFSDFHPRTREKETSPQKQQRQQWQHRPSNHETTRTATRRRPKMRLARMCTRVLQVCASRAPRTKHAIQQREKRVHTYTTSTHNNVAAAAAAAAAAAVERLETASAGRIRIGHRPVRPFDASSNCSTTGMQSGPRRYDSPKHVIRTWIGERMLEYACYVVVGEERAMSCCSRGAPHREIHELSMSATRRAETITNRRRRRCVYIRCSLAGCTVLCVAAIAVAAETTLYTVAAAAAAARAAASTRQLRRARNENRKDNAELESGWNYACCAALSRVIELALSRLISFPLMPMT